MTAKYYNQWDDLKESLETVESDNDDTDYSEENDDIEQACCASGCMECLGFSPRDFF